MKTEMWIPVWWLYNLLFEHQSQQLLIPQFEKLNEKNATLKKTLKQIITSIHKYLSLQHISYTAIM
jgi:hypothetical protein